MTEQAYPKFELPGADEELERICKERIQFLYGVEPPSFVIRRFEAELAMMKGTNHSSVYMLVHHLTKHLHKKSYRTLMRGVFGSALVSFLLEITEENPLPAHYRCPNCKYTQWMPEVASGYDLPTEICPHCGCELYGDGHNLPYETCMGLVAGEQEPYVEMHLTQAARETAVLFLVQLLGEERVARACEWNNPVCFMLLPEGMKFEDVTPITVLDPPVYGVRKQTVLPGYELKHVLQKVLLLPWIPTTTSRNCITSRIRSRRISAITTLMFIVCSGNWIPWGFRSFLPEWAKRFWEGWRKFASAICFASAAWSTVPTCGTAMQKIC